MELELQNADEGPEIIKEYNDPLLRFFNVPKFAVADQQQRKANEETRWHAVSPGHGGENSAVAYFFAAKLRDTCRNHRMLLGRDIRYLLD